MYMRQRADFYVAPDGNDKWSGRLSRPNMEGDDGPFASLTRAQQAIRQLKAEEPNRTYPVVVQIRGGTYYLEEPLRFTPEDSGTDVAPVIYMAYPGEKPVISGGTPIKNWEQTDNGRWQVYLPAVKQGKWMFTQLWVNGERRYRPRLPKKGYFFITEEVPPTSESEGKGFDRFKFQKGQISGNWHNLNDVELLCFHIWSMSRMRVGSVDERNCIVTFTGPTCTTGYGAALYKGNRFLVENVREALEEPGQWYLDRANGLLTYVPIPGEDVENTEVIAPRLDQLLLLEGDIEKRRWVQYVRFEGLVFSHTNWVTPSEGYSSLQAEIYLNAAVYAEGARHCALINCTITHVGEYAVQWARACRYNLMEGCEMIDLGAGGVKIGHTYAPGLPYGEKDDEALVSHHVIRDCLIAQGGRMHPAAVGIWIGHSPYNRVEYNEITDLYYSGVSVGWIWGYEFSHAHHNLLAFNHIHNLGQNVLSDMGAIYILGVGPGTIIRCNHIHDVNAFDYGGWGIYFDQGARDIVAVDNVCYRFNGQSFHQHYGRDNYLANNIFAISNESQIERTKQEDHCSFVFEHNIIYWEDDVPLLGNSMASYEQVEKGLKMDYNLYYNAGGYPILFKNDTFTQWQAKGCDRHSLIADPLFFDPANGDFRLKPDSPARKIGFNPIDIANAGRLTTKTQDRAAKSIPPAFPTAYTADNLRELMDKKFDAAGIVLDKGK